jgi:hypothetical protein
LGPPPQSIIRASALEFVRLESLAYARKRLASEPRLTEFGEAVRL